jgi:hypothetical protein
MLPVVCLVWGDPARNALLSLPYKYETDASKSSIKSPIEPSPPISQSMQSMPDVAHAELINNAGHMDESHKTWRHTQGTQRLTSFLEVVSDNLAQIQLIDSVNLDVLTGKAVILMYTAAVDEARAADADPNKQAMVLLLDAARGMQAVASPLPVRELRRCAL